MSRILFYCLKYLCIPQYNNVLQSWHCKFDTIPNTLCFGKGFLQRCISHFIHPIRPIREKYMNCPKSHKFDDLVLIVGSKHIIQRISRNSGVSNAYTILHEYFEGVEFYDVRKFIIHISLHHKTIETWRSEERRVSIVV